MKHTKQSLAFGTMLADLARQLMTGSGPNSITADKRRQVAELLLSHTSDSPCIVKAKPGEPIFTLVGHDPAGQAAIEAWINKRGELGLDTTDAGECIEEFNQYQKDLNDPAKN